MVTKRVGAYKNIGSFFFLLFLDHITEGNITPSDYFIANKIITFCMSGNYNLTLMEVLGFKKKKEIKKVVCLHTFVSRFYI